MQLPDRSTVVGEEWRSVIDWPYEISNYGIVRNMKTGHILKPSKASRGPKYLRLRLYKANSLNKRFYVHSLVCEIFNGIRPSETHQVAHLDNNPENNKADNLRWATPKQNNADKILHGTYQFGEKIATSKLTEEDVVKIRRLLMSGVSNKEVSRLFNIDSTHVSRIKTGKCWSHIYTQSGV